MKNIMRQCYTFQKSFFLTVIFGIEAPASLKKVLPVMIVFGVFQGLPGSPGPKGSGGPKVGFC